MVYRLYVEKKKELANEAKALKKDIAYLLGIKLNSLRIINRYDVENIEKDLFESCKMTVFAEPQLDVISETLDKNADFIFCG